MLSQRAAGPPLRQALEAPGNEEDAVLVEAARASPAAFEALYRLYLARVYRFIASRAATPEEAADLTQQVFLNAFQALARYRPGPGGFAPWLFAIARNATADAARRRRATTPIEFVAEPLAEPGDSPEQHALRAERLRLLRQRVAGLDPAKQELLALRFAAGLSSAQIAPVVRKSEAAVKKQLSRTIEALREEYRNETPAQDESRPA